MASPSAPEPSRVASTLSEQREAVREQLAAAWQLHVSRIEEQLNSGWREHIERVFEERFADLAARLNSMLPQQWSAPGAGLPRNSIWPFAVS